MDGRSHLQAADQLLQGLGKIPATKTSPDRHDLLTLYHAILEQIRSSIGRDRQAEKPERCRHIFTGSCCQYEKNTPKEYDSTLIEVLRYLLHRVVEFVDSLVLRIFSFGVMECRR